MKTHLPAIIFILLLWLGILVTNFSSSSWLTGWDNLHSEFNLALNFKRAIFSVWQEYQGLGLLGGMGHAADLPRLVLLWLGSLVLPANLLRQGYFFLMLLLGPLGLYFLVLKLLQLKILNQVQDPLRLVQHDTSAKLAVFVGAVFYLLNMATVQMFYVPFEPFATHYGFLPWLVLGALNLKEKVTVGRVVGFTVINLLAVPQAYVPTVFLVYLLALGILILGTKLKNWLVIMTVTLAVNAYWLLPFLYFTVTNRAVVLEAKINHMATENAYLQNKEFGDLTSVATLRGFPLGINDFGREVMQVWQWHWQNYGVWAASLILFGVVLVGVIVSTTTRRLRLWELLVLLAISVIVLANNTPVLAQIDGLLYRVPLVAQVLRFPFTKFSILLAFCYSIFLALGASWLVDRWRRLGRVLAIFILGGVILVVWPVFKGELFSRDERLEIPAEYFRVFDFFASQEPDARIANFPQQTYWGWNKYSWGYSGSGFLWYGVEQPILDRAFDVWSETNENYYWEISYALYSNNLPLFENVLEKYRVSWLLVDGNVVNPSSPKSVYLDEFRGMIGKSTRIRQIRQIGQIGIYSFVLEKPTEGFVSLASGLPDVAPGYKWGNLDQAYIDFGDYTSGVRGQGSGVRVEYPNRTLFTGRGQEDLEFGPTKISVAGAGIVIDPVVELAGKEAKNCNTSDQGEVRNELSENSLSLRTLRIFAKNATNCTAVVDLQSLPHDRGYMITVEARNIAGKPIRFWVENNNSRRADIEAYLPRNFQFSIFNFQSNSNEQFSNIQTSYFVQPPMEADGIGYRLHFDVESIGKEASINDLGKIMITPIDYWSAVRGQRSGVSGQGVQFSDRGSFVVEHPNPAVYRIDVAPGAISKNTVIILSQSYDTGWMAVAVDDSLSLSFRTDHVLISNWANGWRLSEEDKIVYLFYWPQVLESLGMGLLGGLVLGVLYWGWRENRR